MDLLGFAILADLTVYALIGLVIVWIGKRWLPAPWNKASMMVPVMLSIGAMITLATLQHWAVFPK